MDDNKKPPMAKDLTTMITGLITSGIWSVFFIMLSLGATMWAVRFAITQFYLIRGL